MAVSRFLPVRIVGFSSNLRASKFFTVHRWSSTNSGSVEIDPREHVFVHPDFVEKLKDHRSFGVQTAFDIVNQSGKLYADRKLFSFRSASNEPFQSMTYRQVEKLIDQIGSGIIHLGFEKSNETFLGIYGSANVHYGLFVYSSWPFSIVPVGIYDSLSLDAVRFIIEKTKLKIIFVDNLQRLENLINLQKSETTLKFIISLHEPTKKILDEAQRKNIRILTFDELVKLGKENPTERKPPKPEDVALMMFTSGSTGNPKGCLITHDNLICSVVGISMAIDLITLSKQETVRVLNFMPLAHMFGCGTTLIFTFLGGEVAFWQGSVERLMDDFRDFKPNILTMVPRLLNRLHEKITTETKKRGFLAEYLLKTAINSKNRLIENGDFRQNTIWDKIFFNKIRSAFGGEVKRVVSSSSSLSVDVARLSRAAFSCFFIEGYGQTECITGTWQTTKTQYLGQVGVPTPVNKIKLIDVPEMNYFAQNRQGEICIKSPAVFKSYFEDDEQTKQTITEDGWLLTGDIGQWTDQNCLKIIDRKKNIFKLSQGEFIAPEKLEEIYGRSSFVTQIFIDGDSTRDQLVALLVFNQEKIKEIDQNFSNEQISKRNSNLYQILRQDFHRIAKENRLRSFEIVKRFAVIEQPFTMENGFLTPTFKLRRALIRLHYKKLLNELYED